jgi:hypothetical protein
MADLGFDGMVRVCFAPTVADINAPTVAELGAGVDLEGRLRPDGLATPSDTGRIDNSKLRSTFGTEIVGRRSFSGISVTYVRGPESDTEADEVETALTYRANGFLVVRRDKLATAAWAADDKVEVYPVQVAQPNPANPGPDQLQEVEVGFALTAEPKAFGDFAAVAAA